MNSDEAEDRGQQNAFDLRMNLRLTMPNSSEKMNPPVSVIRLTGKSTGTPAN